MCGFGYGAYGGWGMLAGLGTSVLFWIGVAVLIVWAVRRFAPHPAHGDSALETLRRRLAAGEVSAEEFEKTRRILQT